MTEPRTVRQLLRELRAGVVVPEGPTADAGERRARTIARMAELQSLGRAERASTQRRWRAAWIGLVALLPAAASAAWLVRDGERRESSTSNASPVAPAPRLASGGAASRPELRAPPAPTTRDAPSSAEAAAGGLAQGSARREDGSGARAPSSSAAVVRPALGRASEAPPRARASEASRPARPGAVSRGSEQSTLSEENALLAEAMEARRMGQAGRAVALLDALLARYPGTPLGASAEVERFRALQQAGRRAEAARAARRYLAVHPDGMGSAEARELAVERVSDPGGRGAGRDP